MNILIMSGLGPNILSFGNMGDVSMLQASVSRLAKLWPNATISVLTDSPERLLQFCPGVIPCQAIGRNLWVGEELLLGRFASFATERMRRSAVTAKKKAALHFPKILKWSLTARLRLQNRCAEIEALSTFSQAIATTDLVVVCGAGGFFDGCRDWNMQTLDTVEAAIARRIPVAMFGQHFGPLSDPDVLVRAKRILPQVNFITLRGNPGAQVLLESLGVPASQIQVTGDESIELAYDERPEKMGAHLGINFRFAGSAGTGAREIELIRPILHQFAKKQQVSLVPAPIAVDSSTRDYFSIRQLLQGFDDLSDGGAQLTSPLQVIKQIGRCKVLITCAYHAAVFALAQGIPVVALAKSHYFTEKFRGLEQQFGLGCEIVVLTESELPQRLLSAIERAWQSADSMRASLQKAALRQNEATWGAYHQIKNIVDACT
ncbi:MAG TPA: polysaccharide pyruvyl transferase family protein [Lacunisphaera sp.]